MNTLQAGSTGTDVMTLQNLLAAAAVKFSRSDFNPGPVNGSYSAATQAAVTNLQAALGLPVTGVADDTTWGALTSLMTMDVSQVAFYTAPSGGTGTNPTISSIVGGLDWKMIGIGAAILFGMVFILGDRKR